MSGRFDLIQTPINGLQILQRKPISDRRGYLERLFCAEEFREIFADNHIAQINHTLTAQLGTVRGMHYQYPPHAEVKIVTCLRGEVFDVAVDLRHSSPTFFQWHGELLSSSNFRSLVIPEGFAHGFQTLTDDCEMLYFHTASYCKDSEGGLNAIDPTLNINWPLPVAERSPKDSSLPFLAPDFAGVEV